MCECAGTWLTESQADTRNTSLRTDPCSTSGAVFCTRLRSLTQYLRMATLANSVETEHIHGEMPCEAHRKGRSHGHHLLLPERHENSHHLASLLDTYALQLPSQVSEEPRTGKWRNFAARLAFSTSPWQICTHSLGVWTSRWETRNFSVLELKHNADASPGFQ